MPVFQARSGDCFAEVPPGVPNGALLPALSYFRTVFFPAPSDEYPKAHEGTALAVKLCGVSSAVVNSEAVTPDSMPTEKS